MVHKPQNVAITVNSPTSATLNWTAISDAIGYDIERNGIVVASNVATNSYVDSSLASNTQYTYRVLTSFGAAAGTFNPQTDITWHSLFWAGGSGFAALGLADTNSLTTWPNETVETDASTVGGTAPTYAASHASFNSKSVVNFGNAGRISTAAYAVAPTYPMSLIVIGRATESTDSIFHDGIGGGNRNVIYANASTWSIFAGTTEVAGTATNTSAHFFRGKFDGSTGNDPLFVDENAASNSNAGSQTITGSSLGGNFTGAGYLNGQIALVGIYQGDITADGQWTNFKSWVTSHYGLTIA